MCLGAVESFADKNCRKTLLHFPFLCRSKIRFVILILQTKFHVLIWVNNFWFGELVCMMKWMYLLLKIAEVLETKGQQHALVLDLQKLVL